MSIKLSMIFSSGGEETARSTASVQELWNTEESQVINHTFSTEI